MYHWLVVLFWVCVALVLYTYIGYGLVLGLLVRFKRSFKSMLQQQATENVQPAVTFIVAAYNEADCIIEKLENSLQFDYPKDKIHYFFVTDGSDDGTPELLNNYSFTYDVNFNLFHQHERKGKIAAVNRTMPFVNTSITIYSDANTFVNKKMVQNIVRHYQNPQVGAVAGEKRIRLTEREQASSAGEGLYWKYESLLKKWDAELYSVVGAAGELFSIRTELYQPIPEDTIVEDFFLTMSIAARGYKVAYEPNAYASETGSASIAEELKRKIRIAAGGFQALQRLARLLNPFRYGVLTFQFISHRILRWTLAPLSLPILLIANIVLAWQIGGWYNWLLAGQVLFYSLAILGFILEQRKLKLKAFFIPYYFCFMNYAVYRGFFRFLAGQQSVLWERAKRG